MNHGHHPYTGVGTRVEARNESAGQYAQRMKAISEQASDALGVAKAAMKRQYDRHRREAQDYRTGDWVYLDSFHITTDRPRKKLEDKRYGPFQIIKKIGASAYELKLPRKWKAIHPVFNEVLLTRANPPTFPNQRKPDVHLPEVLDTLKQPEEVYDSKVSRGALQYLVKWKGLPRSENTWESRSSLISSHKALLDAFHHANPTAPRMPTLRIPPRTDTRLLYKTHYGHIVDANHPDYWNGVWSRYQKRKIKQHNIDNLYNIARTRCLGEG